MQCGGFDRLNRRAVIEALEMTRKRDLSRLTRFCPTRKRVFLPQRKSKQRAGAFLFPNVKAGNVRTRIAPFGVILTNAQAQVNPHAHYVSIMRRNSAGDSTATAKSAKSLGFRVMM